MKYLPVYDVYGRIVKYELIPDEATQKKTVLSRSNATDSFESVYEEKTEVGGKSVYEKTVKTEVADDEKKTGISTESYGWVIMFAIALVFFIILAVVTFFEIGLRSVFLGAFAISSYVIGIILVIGGIYYKIANIDSKYWYISIIIGIVLLIIAGVITYVILSQENTTFAWLVIGLFLVSILFLIIGAVWGAYS